MWILITLLQLYFLFSGPDLIHLDEDDIAQKSCLMPSLKIEHRERPLQKIDVHSLTDSEEINVVARTHLRFGACPSLFPHCFLLFHGGLIKMHPLNLSSGHHNNYRSSSISRLTVEKTNPWSLLLRTRCWFTSLKAWERQFGVPDVTSDRKKSFWMRNYKQKSFCGNKWKTDNWFFCFPEIINNLTYKKNNGKSTTATWVIHERWLC